MSLLHARTRPAGPFLEWKVRLFAAGAVLGASGMYLEEGWLTGAGIVVLLGGALLRLLPGDRPTIEEEGGDDREGGDPGAP